MAMIILMIIMIIMIYINIFVCVWGKHLNQCSILNDMFHVSVLWGVQADIVLGQDRQDGPQLKPPLGLGDTVSKGGQKGGRSTDEGMAIIQLFKYHRYNVKATDKWDGEEMWRRGSHSMSVWSLSSTRGWNTRDLFFMPSTQAESGELAKIRPRETHIRQEASGC